MIDHPGQGLTGETMIHVIKLQTGYATNKGERGGGGG